MTNEEIPSVTAVEARLNLALEGAEDWKRWGPYLSERAWGTVREDYSANGTAWDYFPHDHARSRAYRWNEDGLLGISDRGQYLCFALALWNGADSILKERPFGLTGNQGNHGEDVKEYYYFLDCTPSHCYMKALYKYPQRAYPYEQLVTENGRRTRNDPEFELLDTGIFDENRYFDVVVEYAKATQDDLLIRISATNRGPDAAPIHIAPTLWFRNRWSWDPSAPRPLLSQANTPGDATFGLIAAQCPMSGHNWLYCNRSDGEPQLLFTDNETNTFRLFGCTPPPNSRYFKDAFHERIMHGNTEVVNPQSTGTKAAAWYQSTVAPGATYTVTLRLADRGDIHEPFGPEFDSVMAQRIADADAFYAKVAGPGLDADAAVVQRQAFAGMLWSKQFYHLNVRDWLRGDALQPPPPEQRWEGRNHDWLHLANHNVISMPDTWEYPWYASWDLAFHCITLALVDSDFAKNQLILLLREWFMHPNGQLPAYEWAFGDVNPPVHAWAALRVYRIEKRIRGVGDTRFLKRVFEKLLINFTWWVNRKDASGKNVFQGGFLGLDNIGVFDRSSPLPVAGYLEQSDGTSWMAMYCLNMLGIALELARTDGAYEDVAIKFLEHFVYIAHAMNDRPAARGDTAVDLWDDEDHFYYDVLHYLSGQDQFLKVRSIVGIIPLFAVETLDSQMLDLMPDFRRRIEWFLANRPDLCANVANVTKAGMGHRRLFSIVDATRLRAILTRVLDQDEFLSPYGVRSLSRYHKDHPYAIDIAGHTYSVNYCPGESETQLFGGNSNWRGPVWFPINYLLIEALQRLDYYYGESFKIECPTGSGNWMTLWDVAEEISHRLIRLFTKDPEGRRAVYNGVERMQTDPHWCDMPLFFEYFHGDTGAGLGASHQTGWTGLVAKLIQQTSVAKPVRESMPDPEIHS
jgi:hypothetical protein